MKKRAFGAKHSSCYMHLQLFLLYLYTALWLLSYSHTWQLYIKIFFLIHLILKKCCLKQCSYIQYWQVLPSYTCGIFFSKYTNVGILSMPYSFASSSLSIFTNAIPFASHSSSMFSSSNKTFWLFFWSLSSAWKKMRQILQNHHS